ncbi:MAG: hypothetical protein FWE62_01565 [Firmicutes bacterium]|nr:hypothetical protein [Bacillota bacterium]
MEILKIEDMSFRIGERTALKNINLEVDEREILPVLGADREAKRALLRLIAGGHLKNALYVNCPEAVLGIRLSQDAYYAECARIPFGFMTVKQYFRYSTALLGDQRLAARLPFYLEKTGMASKLNVKLKRLSPAALLAVSVAVRLPEQKPVLVINADGLTFSRACAAQLNRMLKGLTELGKTVILSVSDPRLAPEGTGRLAVLKRDGCLDAGTRAEMTEKYFPAEPPKCSSCRLAAALKLKAGQKRAV